MDHEDDDPGVTWNERARDREPDRMSPRRPGAPFRRRCRRTRSSPPTSATTARSATPIRPSRRAANTWRRACSALRLRLPLDPRRQDRLPGRPLHRLRRRRRLRHLDERDDRVRPRMTGRPITMVIFRNYQWGAEKRNTTLWFDDNFVGTELNVDVNYAKVAEACGVKGVQVSSMDHLTEALRTAVKEQMEDGITTFIEVGLEPGAGRTLPPRCHEENRCTSPASAKTTCAPSNPASSTQRVRAGLWVVARFEDLRPSLWTGEADLPGCASEIPWQSSMTSAS